MLNIKSITTILIKSQSSLLHIQHNLYQITRSKFMSDTSSIISFDAHITYAVPQKWISLFIKPTVFVDVPEGDTYVVVYWTTFVDSELKTCNTGFDWEVYLSGRSSIKIIIFGLGHRKVAIT